MVKIFAVLLTIFVLQASVQAADKIRVGVTAPGSVITFPLAQKKGFFRRGRAGSRDHYNEARHNGDGTEQW